MDLGSLELQIFVSLTVVLGGAFVALVCDYLKGNNEQLREHNIELRVRKEEQDRRMLLDPAGMLGQFLPGRKAPPVGVATPTGAHVGTPVDVHETMYSFADPEMLDAAAARTRKLQERTAGAHGEQSDVPPVYASRPRRKRPRRTPVHEDTGAAEWVSPEVMARVAMHAAKHSVTDPDDAEELKVEPSVASPEPVVSVALRESRDELQARPAPTTGTKPEPQTAPADEEPRLHPEAAGKLQHEIERVAQLERRPAEPPPGTILRPLSVPALKLEEELQRVVESGDAPRGLLPAASLSWSGSLLEEVIAASAQPSESRERITPVFDSEVRPELEFPSLESPAIVPNRVTRLELPPPIAVPPVVALEPAAHEIATPALPEAPVEDLTELEFALETEPAVELLQIAEANSVDAFGPDAEPAVPALVTPELFEIPAPVVELPPVVDATPAAESAHEPEPAVTLADGPEIGERPAPIAELAPIPTVASEGEFWLDSGSSTSLPEPVAVEVASEWPEPAEAGAIVACYEVHPRTSRWAGMGVAPAIELLLVPPAPEMPAFNLSILPEPALVIQPGDGESGDEQLPGLLPLVDEELPHFEFETPSVDFLPAFAEVSDPLPPPVFVPEPVASVPPPVVTAAPNPIDISSVRAPEVSAVPVVEKPSDILLPAGMHDLSTWTRLLALPNPLSGILFIITAQGEDGAATSGQAAAESPDDSSASIEKLMSSFVREGDFGARIGDREWVFVYNHDAAGFNQRRVGMVSEKLWDFQLRQIGMANVTFKWGAVDVSSEPLGDALQAARDRMNQGRRARKLPAGEPVLPRRAVNA